MNFCRHDLLFLTEQGRKTAWENRFIPNTEDREPWEQFSNIPAIFRTQRTKTPADWVDVGFSYPLRRNGTRYRIAASVPRMEVIRRITPWEISAPVQSGGMPALILAWTLQETAASMGIRIGFFGSAALQIVTGEAYLHPDSDLDLLLDRAPPQQLQAYLKLTQIAERRMRGRTDIELHIGNGQFIKLKELFQEQKTILVKSSQGPTLVSRRRILESLDATDIK